MTPEIWIASFLTTVRAQFPVGGQASFWLVIVKIMKLLLLLLFNKKNALAMYDICFELLNGSDDKKQNKK